MGNKQTAVNWLMENIDIDFNPKTNTISMRKDIWEKAKQMEKEQLANAWEIGSYSLLENSNGLDFEQYYNETYNK